MKNKDFTLHQEPQVHDDPPQASDPWTTEQVRTDVHGVWSGLLYVVDANGRKLGSMNQEEAKAVVAAHNAERERLVATWKARMLRGIRSATAIATAQASEPIQVKCRNCGESWFIEVDATQASEHGFRPHHPAVPAVAREAVVAGIAAQASEPIRCSHCGYPCGCQPVDNIRVSEPWATLQAICGMTDVREIHLAADVALGQKPTRASEQQKGVRIEL